MWNTFIMFYNIILHKSIWVIYIRPHKTNITFNLNSFSKFKIYYYGRYDKF